MTEDHAANIHQANQPALDRAALTLRQIADEAELVAAETGFDRDATLHMLTLLFLDPWGQ